MSSERRAILEVEGLDFSYGSLQVLFGVDLHVEQGEVLALVGTNGAGKSTLLRVVSGLSRPQRGRVAFRGEDVSGLPPHEIVRRGVVLVPGGRAVFRDMTVAENLEIEGYSLRADRQLLRERTEVALAAFPRLAERLSHAAGLLSGGEQQQLALAKAFLLDPALLLIDELSLGLAPVVVEMLLEAVRSISRAGTTVVVVEQSLNVASALCDRAVFMEKGAVRFEGRMEELMATDELARAVFFGGSDGQGARALAAVREAGANG